LQSQSFGLNFGSLEHKVFWKSLLIALDPLLETMSRNSIQLRQIGIDHNLVAANQIDPTLDDLNKDRKTVVIGEICEICG